jgi:hypothetical protein
VCLVERTNLVTGTVHHEVVQLQECPACQFQDGTALPARERYPGAERWGWQGWTFSTSAEACQRYRFFTTQSAQTGGSAT